MTDQKKSKVDPYRGLKYVGYRMVELPQTYTLQDFVRFAKFQLAVKTKRLLKDPIWDEYTVEELLSEFFAHQFEESKDFREKFEHEIAGDVGDLDDFAAWADKKMEEDSKVRQKTLDQMEDSVSFDPSDIMGEGE